MDIDSDEHKARGFLVTYSTLVLLAWYFDAQLTSFSILGNAINLRSNTENVWLVMALANLYFCIRFLQKMPHGALSPDSEMIASYRSTLYGAVGLFYKGYITKRCHEHAAKLKPGAKFAGPRPTVGPAIDPFDSLPKSSRLTVKAFTSSVVTIDEQGSRIEHSPGVALHIEPHVLLIAYAYVWGYLKGALYKPWFSDRILPFFYGVFAFGSALNMWVDAIKPS